MENIRKTKQKEKLIEYLKQNSNRHLSIKEIQTSLGSEVGQTTIYRMINYLIEEGKVVKIPLDNKQGYCYQYNVKQENCINHYHLICEKCGKLVHFESENVLKVVKDAKQNNDFDICNEKIVFYGICKECRNQ